VHAFHSAGIDVQVRSYEERSMGSNRRGRQRPRLRLHRGWRWKSAAAANAYGVGIDGNIVTASLKALVSRPSGLLGVVVARLALRWRHFFSTFTPGCVLLAST
jgi:2-isopropylmalate synthase